MERLLKIASNRLPWLTVDRWRVYAQTSRGRMVVFVMYSVSEPTKTQADRWFQTNSGEALEIGQML